MAGRLSTRWRTVQIVAVATLLIVTGVVSGGVGQTAAQSTQPETDNTVTRIQVGDSGSASWTVQVRTRLDTAESVREYETFQERIRTNSSEYLDPFRERMRGVVTRAANATGREMRAEEFAIGTTIQEVPRRWGVVTFRFTWSNFTKAADGRLVVGDVFEGGLFLAKNDSLEIHSPAGYTITDVSPPPSEQVNGSVTWVGREDFADERPRVALVTARDQDTGDGSTTQPPSPSAASSDGSPALELLGVGLLLVLGGVGLYVGYQRRTARSVESASAADQSTESTEAPVLTDQERVGELLEERDGRVRQADIAGAFDWSASKTSRVIGSMVEAGDVEKIQLGRENLIERVDEDSE